MNTYSLFTLKLEPSFGFHIENCFDHALRIAVMLDVFVEFEFNEVTCIVRPDDKYEPRAKDWFLTNYDSKLGKQGNAIRLCCANEP